MNVPARSHETTARIFVRYHNHLLDYYLTPAEFVKGISLISSLERGLKEYGDRITHSTELTIYYNIVCLYFGAGEFAFSLHWLNRILNSPYKDLREDIHCFSHILNLIIHYELKNMDLLEYLVKSTYRFLLIRKRLFKFETLILNFMRKTLPRAPGQKELIGSFSDLRKELEAVSCDPFERKALEYFDFISWLDSKITGRPFAEIVKEKASWYTEK